MKTTPETETFLKPDSAKKRFDFYPHNDDVLQSTLQSTPGIEQQTQINCLIRTVQKHLNTENG